MNPLLYGHSTDERIVAVQQKDDRTMRIYFRDLSGVRSEDQKFFPFFHLAETTCLEGFPHKHWVKRLDGGGFYQYLCAFEEWPILWEAIRFIIDRHNRKALTKAANYLDLDFLFLYPDPVSQYLLQTGRTLFKGMKFDELHRMQLDIETYTPARFRFSSSARASDRIILIALSDNRGWEHLIDGKKHSEEKMLVELGRIVSEKDPDVIEGHNIFNFDLPYIAKRCELHGVALDIGRDGSSPRVFESRFSFGERSSEYTVTDVAGRHIVDTLLLVQNYDMGKRDMESYGLKYAAQYFGLSSPARTIISGDRISWHWDHDVEPLMKYAMDDVTETRKLAGHLSGTSFYLTQMLPFNYGQVVRMGSASKIESLMVREYLHQKHSLPQPGEGVQTSGGYTDIFTTGVLGPIVHVDVESLYPSIMIRNDISPESDVKGVFPELLRNLTAMRLEAKQAMKKAQDPTEKARLDASQSSLKILINSFYGYLGYTRALFNDFSKADLVTQAGQSVLRHMMASIQSAGGKVIEVDTDGVFFSPPDNVRDDETEQQFVHRLSREMPEGIAIAIDGRYQKMLSYKKKNYALLGYDKKIKTKGSSLTSRSMERFGRTYILQCIACLLNENIDGLHTLYTALHQKITAHRLDILDFARVETLKDTLQEYTLAVEAGKRNKSAAYEVALQVERGLRPGDKVAYYITGTDPNLRSFENCKPVDEWDPNFPDENVQFYLRRLNEFSEKFRPFFLPQDFRAIFSADDLFPFNSTGITLLTVEAVERELSPAEDAAPPELGGWPEE